ncbi:MAG: methyltransferase domain-containing protein [Bacteroidales bacterium]|nr:methyltransferase domain-containing protein [Bacteroidales bacterium]
MPVLKNLANNRNDESFANTLRRNRFSLFLDFIEDLPRPLKIIDVGGTQLFWEQMNFLPGKDVEITILNLTKPETDRPGFVGIKGDATDMSQIPDNAYDVAFSNSVIEHVGGLEEQQKMADEMQRIAKNIFVQTPNRYFPIEPHFLFPFFQFLPLGVQVWLLTHFQLGWHPKHQNKNKAKVAAKSIRLLTKSELHRLFPDSAIHKERIGFLSKSFILVRKQKELVK